MTSEEFEAWLPGTIAGYAAEHVRSGRWSEEETLERSRAAPTAFVYNIEIYPQFRRRGYAEQAMLKLEDETRRLGRASGSMSSGTTRPPGPCTRSSATCRPTSTC